MSRYSKHLLPGRLAYYYDSFFEFNCEESMPGQVRAMQIRSGSLVNLKTHLSCFRWAYVVYIVLPGDCKPYSMYSSNRGSLIAIALDVQIVKSRSDIR